MLLAPNQSAMAAVARHLRTVPKRKSLTVVKVCTTQAMELYRLGYAKISTGEIKLTPAGKKQLGKSASACGW